MMSALQVLGCECSNALSVATQAEIIEAVRELEAEGLLQYIERTQTVVIRGH